MTNKIIESIAQMKEVDVLILPHHGSSKDFTTSEFLKALNPTVCIALVDRENQYGHPDATVCQRVNADSWYYSTKDGDVIIETSGDDNKNYTVYDYITGGENRKSVREFESKKVVEYRKSLGRAIDNAIK